MTLKNWTKLIVAVVTILCITILMGTKAISSGEGLPIITLVIGYILGNGIAARSGVEVEPIIATTHPGEPAHRHYDEGRITLDLAAGWALMIGGAIAGLWGICYLLTRI